jgi:hypothetical protein
MGSKFVEKHKRKSVLAALLFIFGGRAKYVGILLVVTILSLPFVISGETLNSIIELPGVSAFLRSVGLGSVVSAVNPKYANDALKAALDKAASESEQNSFWQKFLKSVNATLPPGGGPSSIAMIRGGNDDIFGPPELKDKAYDKAKAGDVKGAVNDEERANGENGGGVDLQGLLAGGGMSADGGYGGSMGEGLAENFASGAGGSNSPYMNRMMFSGRGGAAGQSAGVYSNLMAKSGSRVPVPNSPAKVNTKRMGRVSGFTWKNVGYKTKNNKMDIKMGTKKPMFQLAQTFGMTGAAYKSKDSALEYQAAYTGATYDGNDANLDVLETDSNPPAVPDTSFTGDLIDGAAEAQDLAKKCSDAQGTHGAAMSDDGKKMDDTARTLGKPPKCCSSGVGAWNAKIDRIIGYCQDFNSHEAQLAAACQNKSSPMDCGSYSKMKIKPCSKLKCWLMIIIMIVLAFLTFGGSLLAAAVVGVIAAGSMLGGNMFGPIGDMVSGFISKLAGGE